MVAGVVFARHALRFFPGGSSSRGCPAAVVGWEAATRRSGRTWKGAFPSSESNGFSTHGPADFCAIWLHPLSRFETTQFFLIRCAPPKLGGWRKSIPPALEDYEWASSRMSLPDPATATFSAFQSSLCNRSRRRGTSWSSGSRRGAPPWSATAPGARRSRMPTGGGQGPSFRIPIQSHKGSLHMAL